MGKGSQNALDEFLGAQRGGQKKLTIVHRKQMSPVLVTKTSPLLTELYGAIEISTLSEKNVIMMWTLHIQFFTSQIQYACFLFDLS